jgi:hypothetical protein
MNRLPRRRPLLGPTMEHLRHRERIDWHDHAEQQLLYPSSGVLIVSTTQGSWVVPPQRAVWLPAAVAHAHQAYGATQVRTVAFPVDVNPLGLTQPTVLSVPRLLRELIIALTDDPARRGEEQHDLKRVALHQLKPAPALQFHLPPPGDARLRDVTAILAEDPGSDRTLGELGRAVGAGERTLEPPLPRRDRDDLPAVARPAQASPLPDPARQWPLGHRHRDRLRLQHPERLHAAFHATFGTTPGTYRKDLAHARAA